MRTRSWLSPSGRVAGAAAARVPERGVALIWALLGATLVLGIVFAGTARFKALREITQHEFSVQGQARQVAESGLVEALAWLRRESNQPVTEFAPKRDLAADPIVDDTDDPAVGITRTFRIGPSLWGRFVVRKGRAAEAFVDANRNGYCDPDEQVHDLDHDGKRTMAFGMRDVSTYRDLPGGTVWHLESEGRVYARPREDLPLGEGPNVPLGTATLATQVRRLVVELPATAALIQSRASEVGVKKGTRITSPVQGIAYRAGTGSARISRGVSITAPVAHAATPWLAPAGGWMDGSKRRIAVEEIFGVDLTTLAAIADFTVGATRARKGWQRNRFGYTFPTDALVVVKAASKKGIEFDRRYPLRGRGILVVDGNLDVKNGSASRFEGILVVLGNLTVHGPATFRGMVVVQKQTRIQGGKVQIDHDPALVNRMLVELGRYRRFKCSFTPSPATLDERPNEAFLTATRPGGLPLDGGWTMPAVR